MHVHVHVHVHVRDTVVDRLHVGVLSRSIAPQSIVGGIIFNLLFNEISAAVS